MRVMRARAPLVFLLPPLLALAGCDPASQVLGVGAFGASVAIFHRTPVDMVYSAVTGKNCSAVRLDRGESYCKPPEAEPPPQPYCTRSLGTVDCWARPYAMRDLGPQVADGPRTLTPVQERDRTSGWLNL